MYYKYLQSYFSYQYIFPQASHFIGRKSEMKKKNRTSYIRECKSVLVYPSYIVILCQSLGAIQYRKTEYLSRIHALSEVFFVRIHFDFRIDIIKWTILQRLHINSPLLSSHLYYTCRSPFLVLSLKISYELNLFQEVTCLIRPCFLYFKEVTF